MEEVFPMSRIYSSADELIGSTPLLEVKNIEREEGLKARVLVKLEYFMTFVELPSLWERPPRLVGFAIRPQ